MNILLRYLLLATLVAAMNFAGTATAEEIKLTIYDDGKSCPAGCDAHVVFHRSMNGTEFAHSLGSSAAAYETCTRNALCEICFDGTSENCIEIMYRGTGPGKATFDFTPAFYESWCAKPELPRNLRKKCEELSRVATKLDGRINCIRQPQHENCSELMAEAMAARTADGALYEECIRVGQAEFNGNREPAERRALTCAYEEESAGGPNSNGLTWRRLLPGACREGTFVGRDGLDCCSGSKLVDGALGLECKHFYPKP